MKSPGVVLIVALLAGCASTEETGHYKGYELPPYAVQKSEGAVELRDYKPRLVAEVTVDGTRDEAANTGFRILASYIFGENVPQQKVTMTTPVAQKPADEKIAMTSPVSQRPEGEKWVVQFGMPKQYTLDTLPKAKDSRIRFRVTEPARVAAIRFSGRWSDARFQEHKTLLEQFITAQQLTPVSPPSFAYYDDPFTLPWNRRNEILVAVQ